VPVESVRAACWTLLLASTYILVYNYALAENHHHKFLLYLTIAGAVIIGLGYRVFMMHKLGLIPGHHDMPTYFIGTFWWKNPMATFIGLIIPITFYLLIKFTRLYARIPLFIFLVALILAMILTGSRAAWLSIFIAALATVIIFYKSIKIKGILLIISAIIIALALTPLFTSYSRILGRVESASKSAVTGEIQEGSIRERTDLYQAAFNIFLDHPILGGGAGSFDSYYPTYMKGGHFASRYVHNQYLEFLAENGILGALIFLLLMISCLTIPILKRGYLLPAMFFAAFLFFALHILLDLSWHIPVLGLMAFTYIGLLAQQEDKYKPIRGWGLLVVALIPTIFFILFATSQNFLSFGKIEYSKGRPREALKNLKLAKVFMPLYTEPYLGLASIYSQADSTEKVEDLYQRALTLDKRSPDILANLGRIKVQQNQLIEAIRYYKKAIEYGGRLRPQYYNELARLYLGSNDIQKAKQLYQTVAKEINWKEGWAYNERTVSHRYYVAEAYMRLSGIVKDSTLSQHYQAYAETLFTPREFDRIAWTFGDSIKSPEWVVKEFFTHWTDNNRELANKYLVGGSKVSKLEAKLKGFKVLEVEYNYFQGRAYVTYLLLLEREEKLEERRGRFKLLLTDKGWRIEPTEK